MKSRDGKSQRREEKKKEDQKEKVSEERRSRCAKGRKVAKHCFFQWFVAPEGRKVGSLKRRVRSQLARWEMKNCTPLRCEAHFKAKMYKTHQVPTTLWKLRCWKSARRCGAKYFSKSKCTKHTRVRTTFGSWDVKQVHAVVARSTFRSQNVQNTSCSHHFWKLRCWKSARRCGAKYFSKSKCTKHTRVRTTFGSWDVEKVHAVVARSTFRSQNVQNTSCSDHFWKLRCLKSARRCGAKHMSK